MNKPLRLSAFILIITALFLNRHVFAAEPIPLRVNAKVNQSYVLGLPLRVTVEITNVSSQSIETLMPRREFTTILARLKLEGSDTYLSPTRHQDFIASARKTVQLNPGDKASGQIDLSAMFQDDLPLGRYLCEVGYAYGKKLIWSKPVLLIIEEPRAPTLEEQRDVRLAMKIFLSARILLSEGDDTSLELAHRLFSYLSSYYQTSEYGKISTYYVASLEKDPNAALTVWLKYQKHPAMAAPDLLNKDDILRIIGRLYYQVSNFKAARKTFLEIVDPDPVVLDYIRKIESQLPNEKTP